MWKSIICVLLLGCSQEQTKLGIEPGEDSEIPAGEGIFVDTEWPDITTFALLSSASVGDLVISEVMHTPTQSAYDSYGEWIELYNASGVALDLNGLVISSTSAGDSSVTFSNSLVLPAGEYVLLATRSSNNGGLSDIDGYYSSASIRHNASDDLTISYSGTTFDSITWNAADSYIVTGASISLDGDDRNATTNDSTLHWFAGYQSYGDGDYGTPGTANTPLKLGTALSANDLVISEIMVDPVFTIDWKGEWFEVYNNSSSVIQLSGLDVSSSNDTGFTVADNFAVPPEGYAVFGNRISSADNGGYTLDVYFLSADFGFGAADDVTLSSGGTTVDSVSYTDGASYVGKSMNLTLAAFDSTVNDTRSMWCVAATPYGVGDYGTPGDANSDCPDLDYDGDGFTLEDGDCDDTDPLIGLATEDEVCDGIDNDCDGLVDEDDDSLVYDVDDIWYLDFDGDGYGAETSLSVYACEEPTGYDPYVGNPYVQNSDDCDDFDADLNEDDADGDTVSTCDGDCDDTDATLETLDTDGDGYTTCDGDCDDTDIASYPDASEIANDGIDQDCDGSDSICVDCDSNLDLGGGFTLDFVEISAGSFSMGSPTSEVGRSSNETQHTVTLTNNFYVMTTEVTQGMFYQLMEYQAYDGYSQTLYPYGYGDDYPAYYVSWDMAGVFANAATQYHNTLYGTTLNECYACNGTDSSATCSQAMDPYTCTGYRLLTEAEWEYVARAGDSAAFWTSTGSGNLNSGYSNATTALSNGFDLQTYGWYSPNSSSLSQSVGQLLPNDFGVYDMSGNVLEWVHDFYASYPSSSVTDPVTILGSYRVTRGGYWGHGPALLRSAARSSSAAANRSPGIGFRLGRTL